MLFDGQFWIMWNYVTGQLFPRFYSACISLDSLLCICFALLQVTLMFIDQNGREHVVDAFRPDPTSSSFKRPTSEMNIASGCPLLMPLTTLDTQNNAYVKDNTAFIKIIVNCEDLN